MNIKLMHQHCHVCVRVGYIYILIIYTSISILTRVYMRRQVGSALPAPSAAVLVSGTSTTQVRSPPPQRHRRSGHATQHRASARGHHSNPPHPRQKTRHSRFHPLLRGRGGGGAPRTGGCDNGNGGGDTGGIRRGRRAGRGGEGGRGGGHAEAAVPGPPECPPVLLPAPALAFSRGAVSACSSIENYR